MAADRLIELLWEGRKPAQRGPRPALTVDRIAETAVRIADADGIDAVAMHRVADELGFTKMALYRYVAGKDELVATMIERAVGTPPDLADVRGWRPRAEEFVAQLSAAWHQHPWLPWITRGDRVMGPNELGWVESALSIFEGTNLNPQERMDAVFTIFGHIRNTQSPSTAGTQPWTTNGQVGVTISDLVQRHSDRFPVLSQFVATGATSSTDLGREFGLQRLLDGLEDAMGQ